MTTDGLIEGKRCDLMIIDDVHDQSAGRQPPHRPYRTRIHPVTNPVTANAPTRTHTPETTKERPVS